MNNQKIFLQRYKTRTDVNLWTKPLIQANFTGQTLEKPFDQYQDLVLKMKYNNTLDDKYYSKYQQPVLRRNNNIRFRYY